LPTPPFLVLNPLFYNSPKMIVYGCVADFSTCQITVEGSIVESNASELVTSLLSRLLKPSKKGKKARSSSDLPSISTRAAEHHAFCHEGFTFLLFSDPITNPASVYVCISDEPATATAAGRSRAFVSALRTKYLEGVDQTAGNRSPVLTPATIVKLCRSYSGSSSTVSSVQADVDEVRDRMAATVDAMVARGDAVDDLLLKTDELADNTHVFRKRAREVARTFWWQRVKLQITLVALCLVIGYVIAVVLCGGWALDSCISGGDDDGGGGKKKNMTEAFALFSHADALPVDDAHNESWRWS